MQFYVESFKTFNKLLDLGVTLSKLSSVSCQTIMHRSALMQQGAASLQWQQNEAQTMALEKVDAAEQGSQVLWKGWVEMNQSLLGTSERNLQRFNRIKIPSTPFDLITTQKQWFKATELSAVDTLKLSDEVIDTLNKSIKPAFRYASGNAERLSIRKQR